MPAAVFDLLPAGRFLLPVGDRKGWRLPQVQELASLMDATIPTPATTTLPTGHPLTEEPATVWSATTRAGNETVAWRVFVAPVNQTSRIRAWCVRGGTVADVQ